MAGSTAPVRKVARQGEQPSLPHKAQRTRTLADSCGPCQGHQPLPGQWGSSHAPTCCRSPAQGGRRDRAHLPSGVAPTPRRPLPLVSACQVWTGASELQDTVSSCSERRLRSCQCRAVPLRTPGHRTVIDRLRQRAGKLPDGCTCGVAGPVPPTPCSLSVQHVHSALTQGGLLDLMIPSEKPQLLPPLGKLPQTESTGPRQRVQLLVPTIPTKGHPRGSSPGTAVRRERHLLWGSAVWPGSRLPHSARGRRGISHSRASPRPPPQLDSALSSPPFCGRGCPKPPSSPTAPTGLQSDLGCLGMAKPQRAHTAGGSHPQPGQLVWGGPGPAAPMVPLRRGRGARSSIRTITGKN